MARTAKSTPKRRAGGAARAGGEFFARPTGPNHRRYEALRGYLYEGLTIDAAAARAGYSPTTLRSAVRDFRGGKTGFFLNPRPGPTRAPAKNAAREKIIELRQAGHSAKEIAEALTGTPTPLNRTGVAEVLAEAGFGRLPVRPPAQRGAPYRDHPRRAQLLDFTEDLPARAETKVAGLLLAVPELVALNLPEVIASAGYPGTAAIPALNYMLSLLALKLVGIRRVSHVDDLAADPGAALFAGLAALPKTTALTSYSYQLDHTRQQALLTGLGKQMLTANLITDAGGDLDLDFHAIMHWGQDVALEKHYVPSRSQRTRSVLSFFAQDGASQTLVYANADLTKATQSNEVLVFAEHWRSLTGHWPTRLVMDQKVTTQEVLAELDTRGIKFITLRMRSASLLRHINALPTTAWKTVRLDRDGAYNRPKVVDEAATLSNYPRPVRQLVVRGLGRDAATVIITNDPTSSAKQIIERYARRMNIEQRLAESIRSFHLDALSGAVPLNVDLDVALTVLAGAVCASLRRRLTGLPRHHPRHPATTIPIHHRSRPQRRRHHHRPSQPAHLLTGPAPSRHPRHRRPLVGRPTTPLRVRLTKLGVELAARKSALGRATK